MGIERDDVRTCPQSGVQGGWLLRPQLGETGGEASPHV